MFTPISESETEIISFWFSARAQALWFNSDPAFDAEIRTQFEEIYQQAKAGALDAWRSDAQGALALCILLDQFPLNMYRGLAASFATEAMAREVAKSAIDAGLDQAIGTDKRAFFYLPFMHSEHLNDQNYSVNLFERAGMTEGLHYAKHHREIIRRFGRFPHRNAILKRASTEQELAYLASPEAFKG
ncbi:MAG: DUF924 family protein [Pseudomonadota bacterium]